MGLVKLKKHEFQPSVKGFKRQTEIGRVIFKHLFTSVSFLRAKFVQNWK